MRFLIFCILYLLLYVSCSKPRQKHFVQVRAVEVSEETIRFKLSREANNQANWTITRIDHTEYQFPKEFMTKLLKSVESCPSCYDINNDTIYERILDISVANKSSNYFETRDMNFDGYFDLSFTSSATCCAGKNVLNEVWLYNAKSKTFVYNAELSDGSLWDYNEKEKILVIGWSMRHNEFSSSIYKSVGGKMKKIQQETVEPYNDSLLQIITEKLVDTVWVSDTTFENP